MNKYKVVYAELDGQWIKLYYHRFRGYVIHTCFLYETDVKNDSIPEWFGKIVR